MRRSLTVAIAGVAVAAAVVGTALGTGTLARFTDAEAGPPGSAATATVVLGGRSTPVALSATGVRAGSPRTLSLTVVYLGTVPATIQLRLPAGATETSCQRSGTTWTDASLVGTLTLTPGTQPAVAYCALLDGTARTLVATVAPGSTTTVPITVTAGGLALLGRTERAQIAVRAVGGFSDQVLGTITISTSALFGARAVALSAPAPATVAAPVPTVPAACPGPYAETVVLTAARPRFVAAEDRPGAPGPFAVLGTPGDDTVVGSGAGDCLVGGAGVDVLDGAGGDDVLLGEAGVDRLTGGPGADVLDGGADLADCDTDPADRTTGCRTPVAEGVPDPTTTVPPRTADPPATDPPAAPAVPAPQEPPPTAAPEPAPTAVPETPPTVTPDPEPTAG